MAIMINVVNDDCGPKPIRVKKNTDFFFTEILEICLVSTYENIFPTSNDITFYADLFYQMIFRETVKF